MLKNKEQMLRPDLSRFCDFVKANPKLLGGKVFTMWKIIEGKRKDGSTDFKKVPFRTDDKPGSSTKPEDWCDFETARYNYAMGDFNGIGVILNKDRPLACIDLDGGRKPDGSPEPWVLEIFAKFPGAFIEPSVSGGGWHIFCEGTLPEDHRKKSSDGKVEIYTDKRFIVMTCNAVPGVTSDPTKPLANCQQALEALEKTLAPNTRKSRSSVKTKADATDTATISLPLDQQRKCAPSAPVSIASDDTAATHAPLFTPENDTRYRQRQLILMACNAMKRVRKDPLGKICIMPGDPLDHPLNFFLNQLQLVALCTLPSEYVKDGDKYAALWLGKWEGQLNSSGEPYPSQSEADAALISRFVYMSGGDAYRAIEIFGYSGLAKRAKWQDNPNYRAQCLKFAISCTEREDSLVPEDFDPFGDKIINFKKVSQALQIFNLIKDKHCEIFSEKSSGEILVSFARNGHKQLASINSDNFSSWLYEMYKMATGLVPSQKAVSQAIMMAKSRAYNDAPRSSFLRIAEQNKNIYINLADPMNNERAIEITPDGCNLVDESPVLFKTTATQLPLPEPDFSGSLNDLRPFLRVSDSDFALLCFWLFQAIIPDINYFILGLSAEKGSGKTFLTNLLKNVADPNTAGALNPLDKPEDYIAVAKNQQIFAIDNFSNIRRPVSDILCRIATGSGWMARKLFTNLDSVAINVSCAMILNDINLEIKYPDLLSRMLKVNLKPFAPGECGSEKQLRASFERAHPKILGALCSALAAALKHQRDYPDYHIDFNNRMTDSVTLWCRAELAGAVPFAPGTLKQVLLKQEDTGALEIMTGDPYLMALNEVLEDHFDEDCESAWKVSLTELHDAIEKKLSEKEAKYLANKGQKFKSWLAQFTSTLRQVGFDIVFEKKYSSKGAMVTVTHLKPETPLAAC